MTSEENQIDTDYNLENDVIPDPLVAEAKNIPGKITTVDWAKDDDSVLAMNVVIGVCSITMTDGTPAEGKSLYHRVTIPHAKHKTNDDGSPRLTKKGDKVLWQVFVNMLANFSKNMKWNMNTRADIQKALDDNTWLAYPVYVDVVQETGDDGVVRNKIKKMVARFEHNEMDDNPI